MKRLLWLACLSLFFSACGDDSSGGGDGSEDGGVSFADITNLENALDDLRDELGDVQGDVDGLNTDVDGIGSDLDSVSGTADDLDMRVDALEDPTIPNCSESESGLCIPDGIGLVEMGVRDIVARLCSLEIDCCTADELNYKFGPGITSVQDCTDTFVDLVNNGFSPGFLQGSGPIVASIINIAQAVNNPDVHVEVDQGGVTACVDFLNDRECPKFATPGTVPARCTALTPASDDYPCDLEDLLNGLNDEGEECGIAGGGVPECIDGTVCRLLSVRGICVTPAAEGEHCSSDAQCDRNNGSGLFCNRSTGVCQALGVAGDPCGYIDDTFARDSAGIDHGRTYSLYGSDGTALDCAPGFECDPASKKCVLDCSNGALCNPAANNADCPDGTVCNVTEFRQLAIASSTPVYGVCRAPTANGAACNDLDGSECASGRCGTNPAFSGPPDPVNICLVAKAAAGATCPGGVAGVADPECETMRCNRAGKCATACTFGTPTCQSGTFCDQAAPLSGAGPPYSCEPLFANTVACGNDANGTVHTSCVSGFCNTGAGVLCAPKVGSLAACASNIDQECPSGQWCNAGTCQALFAADASCAASPGHCIAGHYCTSGTTLCKPYRTDGQDCNGTDALCTPGLQCSAGSVTKCHMFNKAPNGANCANDFQCASVFCAGTACADPIADGANCDVTNPSSGATHQCGANSYCKYDPNGTTFTGKCTPKGTSGVACDPRFSQRAQQTGSQNYDCLNNQPCQLQNDTFVCGTFAVPTDTLFCDGT